MEKNPFTEFDLCGTVAVVTGAGRGMGYHIALGLAKYGSDLVICSRTVPELEALKAEVKERYGRKVLVQKMDVTKIAEIDAMVEAAVKTFGRIDILVNNAGINIPQWAVEVTEEAWDKVIDLNLKGLFFCAQAVGKVMIRQNRGKIINISSQTGTVGIPQRAAYCSSKGGVDQLTKVLAIEWAPKKVRVNAIAPGYIRTELVQGVIDRGMLPIGAIEKRTPLGRIGEVDDLLGLAVYLASDESSFMTGSVINIDGGWEAYGYL